eukprot:CAMPEP_0180518390 /NCGR_PEP_ID=MMETSP1036_2-20121128/55074_1 /TAXON_ID=632150 /ORGANISM="Azadinium spinosum, Strain 3D9" /LENGTH=44 /DNA_ID= /DNA_START= /DNA_END= /DNA_ORIENTATION=
MYVQSAMLTCEPNNEESASVGISKVPPPGILFSNMAAVADGTRS